jgi:hypothetical protein
MPKYQGMGSVSWPEHLRTEVARRTTLLSLHGIHPDVPATAW